MSLVGLASRAGLTAVPCDLPQRRRTTGGAAAHLLRTGATAEVARRLGHSIEVLLRVYVNCIGDGDTHVNERIGDALS